MTRNNETTSKVLNIGKGTKANKNGQFPARIWIENDSNNILYSVGFIQGATYFIYGNQLVLSSDNSQKLKKVSGHKGKAIIDLTGKTVLTITGGIDSGKVLISAKAGTITINTIQG